MATIDQSVFKAMEWRCIGPHRGGRTVAAVGDPDGPMTFYFGACNGGVWKTDDGGTYWENISDGFLGSAHTARTVGGIHMAFDRPVQAPDTADGTTAPAVAAPLAPGFAANGGLAQMLTLRLLAPANCQGRRDIRACSHYVGRRR